MTTAGSNQLTPAKKALLQTLMEVAQLAISDLIKAANGDASAIGQHLQSLQTTLQAASEDLATPPADTREVLSDVLDLLREVNSSLPNSALNPGLRARIAKYALLKMPPERPITQLAAIPLQRWDVMSNSEEAIPDEPAYDLTVALDRNMGQVHLTVLPQGKHDPDSTQDMPQLYVVVEINNGAPCAHLFGDAFGEVGATVFGMPGARLSMRPGSAPVDHQTESFSPDVASVAEALSGRSTQASQPRMR